MFFAVGHNFLGIVKCIHLTSMLSQEHGLQGLCTVRRTVPCTVLCSPAPCWALIQYCDHTKIISLAAPAPLVLFTIFTLLTLYNIIDKIYNIYTASYCNSAARHKPQYTSSPLPPVRPPQLLPFFTAPFTAAAHVLMRAFLPFPPTIMNIFGRSGAFYSQGRTHNALML